MLLGGGGGAPGGWGGGWGVVDELRTGEFAALDVTPLTRYYGTVDATLLFFCLLAEHAQWSGSLELFHELREAAREHARLDLRIRGDHDGDGLLDYRVSRPRPAQPGLARLRGRRARRARRAVGAADRPDRAAGLRGPRQARHRPACSPMPASRTGRGPSPPRPPSSSAASSASGSRDRRFFSLALDGDGRASGALASNQGTPCGPPRSALSARRRCATR